jgi:hypothetical protein
MDRRREDRQGRLITMHLRRSFPVRRDTYHSAVDFGAMVGARMAGYDWSPPPARPSTGNLPPGSGGILGAASGPDGGVGAEVTQKQIISLGILGVGGVLATYLFMTGSMLSGTLILGATLLTGAVVEGGSGA